MQNANQKQPAPDWAPDNCPADVVSLVRDEQYLQDLNIRGLSSADSKEVHQAVRRLRSRLAEQWRQGRALGFAWGLSFGYFSGALCGGLLIFWAFGG